MWKGAGSSFSTSPVCVALRQQTEETIPEPTPLATSFKTLTSVCCNLDFFVFVLFQLCFCFVFLWHIDCCTGGHTQHTHRSNNGCTPGLQSAVTQHLGEREMTKIKEKKKLNLLKICCKSVFLGFSGFIFSSPDCFT